MRPSVRRMVTPSSRASNSVVAVPEDVAIDTYRTRSAP